MEEPEKRRERLRAMRMQADLTESSNNVESVAMPGCLSNPLIEAPSTDEFCAPPRFDYYTDPMAAFSANRKKGKPDRQMHHYFPPPDPTHSPRLPVSSPFIGPMRPQMIPSPTQRFQAPRNPFWDGSGGAVSYNYPSLASPTGSMGPQVIPSPSQRFQAPVGNPVWDGSGGSVSYSSPSLAPPTGNFPSHGFNSWSSPLNNTVQSNMQWRGHSPNLFSGRGRSFNSGRGRGWYNNANPSLGRGGERGQGSPGRFSGAGRPRGPSQFYNSSMVEDPWKFLKPVVWKGAGVCSKTPASSEPFGIKKPRTYNASDKSSSEPNLAEYLAASFHEMVSSEANET